MSTEEIKNKIFEVLKEYIELLDSNENELKEFYTKMTFLCMTYKKIKKELNEGYDLESKGE